jgi:hypothetical protein
MRLVQPPKMVASRMHLRALLFGLETDRLIDSEPIDQPVDIVS